MVAIYPFSIHAITALLIFQQLAFQMDYTQAKTPIPDNYIKNSCKTTLYPQLCYRFLSVFAPRIGKSPRIMAQTALAFTLSTTRKTSIKLNTLSKNQTMKPREKAAMVDCLEELSDSISELEMSMKEMGRTGSRMRSKFQFMLSDIETWVSAALTDDSTCMDGFSDSNVNGEVKIVVKGLVLNVAQLTSIALALVNHYATS